MRENKCVTTGKEAKETKIFYEDVEVLEIQIIDLLLKIIGIDVSMLMEQYPRILQYINRGYIYIYIYIYNL